MYYTLSFNMDKIDETIGTNSYPIYAEVSNVKEIRYEDMNQGSFRNVFLHMKGKKLENWPIIDFYYTSNVSTLENEYLNNVNGWLIVHQVVRDAFEKNQIMGIQFLPVRVVDITSHNVNNNYYAMNLLNWIDPIDMRKSKYKYNEKYDVYTFFPHATYLIEEKCQKYDIFRCIKSHASIYISDKIKKIFDDNNWDWFLLRKQKMVKAKEKGAIDLER